MMCRCLLTPKILVMVMMIVMNEVSQVSRVFKALNPPMIAMAVLACQLMCAGRFQPYTMMCLSQLVRLRHVIVTPPKLTGTCSSVPNRPLFPLALLAPKSAKN